MAQSTSWHSSTSSPLPFSPGFANGGGMLAAVGFGMLLTTIKCKKLWPYFVIGYIAAAFLGINNVGIGVIAVACVFLHNYFIDNKSAQTT